METTIFNAIQPKIGKFILIFLNQLMQEFDLAVLRADGKCSLLDGDGVFLVETVNGE